MYNISVRCTHKDTIFVSKMIATISLVNIH